MRPEAPVPAPPARVESLPEPSSADPPLPATGVAPEAPSVPEDGAKPGKSKGGRPRVSPARRHDPRRHFATERARKAERMDRDPASQVRWCLFQPCVPCVTWRRRRRREREVPPIPPQRRRRCGGWAAPSASKWTLRRDLAPQAPPRAQGAAHPAAAPARSAMLLCGLCADARLCADSEARALKAGSLPITIPRFDSMYHSIGELSPPEAGAVAADNRPPNSGAERRINAWGVWEGRLYDKGEGFF